MKKANNMYHYYITYRAQCKKAKKNGYCSNADNGDD